MRKISISILLIVAFSNCAVKSNKSNLQSDTSQSDTNTPDTHEYDLSYHDHQTSDTDNPDHQSHDQNDNFDSAESADSTEDNVEPYLYYCDKIWEVEGEYLGYNGCCGDNFKTTSKPEPGMLIKGESFSLIYYYSNDGNRYVIPHTGILESWYSPLDDNGIPISPNEALCELVYECPDTVLANIPLAGNIRKRPGVMIAGINTIPLKYVIDTCSVLKSASDTVLNEIYDNTADLRFMFIPDSFWPNYYDYQEEISSADQFDWFEIYSNADMENELPTSSNCRDEDSDRHIAMRDCDDNDNSIYPGAEELCDQKDNDCDGEIDEDFPTQRFLRDADGDGYGDPNNYIEVSQCVLQPPTGYMNWIEGFDNDCDDQNPAVNPNADELCDGKDNDCDGETDEAFAESLGQECFGWLENGHCTESGIVVCNEPGQVAQLACTTADPPTLYTTADYPAEFCDGKDNNCDGQIDEGCEECTNDADCDDQNPCTENFCSENECIYDEVLYCEPCETDQDCVMRKACELHMENFHIVEYDSACLTNSTCLQSFVSSPTCQNGAPIDEDPSCVENPSITFAANTPSGAFAPGSDTGLARIAVAADSEDAIFYGIVLNVMVIIDTPDENDELWVLEDFSGLALATVTTDISGSAFGVISFNFDYPQVIAAGQTKYYYIYSDTAEMDTSGDVIITWFTTACGNDLYGGQMINP